MVNKFVDPRSFQSTAERTWSAERTKYLEHVTAEDVADSPFLYADRRLMAQMLAKYKLFEMTKNIQGSIVECGVHRGNSLQLFIHFLSIFSPVAFNKKVIGFDTFTGFTEIRLEDAGAVNENDLNDVDFEHLSNWIQFQQRNNFIPHVQRCEIVKGNALETIPSYIKQNPHLIISLLYLDFDLYAPTSCALSSFLPLMPSGSVVAFDQLNQKKWPGETLALKDTFADLNVKIHCFDFEPHISYFIKE